MIRPQTAPALANLIATAWSENAPDASFAGMTLAEFKKAVTGSTTTRDELEALAAQRRAKQEERDAEDKAVLILVQRVIAAVRADANYGSDSPLIGAMGYVTRSQRASGLTRKAQTETATTVAPLAAKAA